MHAEPNNDRIAVNDDIPDFEEYDYDDEEQDCVVDEQDYIDDNQDYAEFLRLREQCNRFRVLIMGKANAGKTTILEKLCKSTEATVRGPNGKLVDSTVLENPARERGRHEIDYEITYESNTGYVFHDSRGFEAGSVDELRIVREFIKARGQERDLPSKLHTIWYCLPTDDDRPLNESELSFFQEGTFGVPVVAIFTKFDVQRGKAITKLKREGLSEFEARKQAPLRMQDICPLLEGRLGATDHPPATYVYLQDMHKPTTDCTSLIEKTASVLNSDVLRHLLVTVQRNNLSLVIKYCITEAFEYLNTRGMTKRPSNRKTIWRLVFKWFPHIWADKEKAIHKYAYNYQWNVEDNNYENWDKEYDIIFRKSTPSLEILSGLSKKCLVLAGLIIIAELSFWMEQSKIESLTKAKVAFENSNLELALNLQIRKRIRALDDEGAKVLHEIVCANLMSKTADGTL